MICSHCLYVDITEPSIIVSVASEGKLRLKMRELSYMQTCNLNFYENLNSAKNYHSFLKLFNIVIIVESHDSNGCDRIDTQLFWWSSHVAIFAVV